MTESTQRVGKRVFFIGSNSVGKTYKLKEIQSDNVDNSVFFDESGDYVSIINKTEVKIFEGFYVYETEKNRGMEREGKVPEKILIRDNLIPIIKFLSDLRSRIMTFRESLGIKKIKSIINKFLNSNLNNVTHVIFDEPENYMDDEHLKVLTRLFDEFLKAGINVYIATHSSRLLEISRAKLDEIHIIKLRDSLKSETINREYKEIKELFESIHDLQNDQVYSKGKLDGGIRSVFCNTNVHNNATKSTELCQLGFSVSTTHA